MVTGMDAEVKPGSRGAPQANRRQLAAALTLAVVVLFLSFWRLDTVPAPWWDEGWTMSVARNWVELGHYGRLLNGEPVADGLSASFVVVAPVALSFRLLGVGIWQARLPGVLYMLGALALTVHLAHRLHGRRVAAITLAVLLLPGLGIHPILMGRQVLAEMPMLFWLLAGYTLLTSALRGYPLWTPLVALCWGLGLASKAQPLPFWALAMTVPIGLSLGRHQWRSALMFGLATFGSLLVWRLMPAIQRAALGPALMERAPLDGLYDVSALVFVIANRLGALRNVLIMAPGLVLGLGYMLLRRVRTPARSGASATELAGISLWVLAASWTGWYLVASVGWPRYLFPPTFLGAPFAALMLCALSDRFSIRSVASKATMAITRLRLRDGAGSLLIILLVVWSVGWTVPSLSAAYVSGADTSAADVASYLNSSQAGEGIVETYASEVAFMLNRPYHFPPDSLSVSLIRRISLGQEVRIDYDPLLSDPEYVVVGFQGISEQAYAPEILERHFAAVLSTPRYTVYQRVR